MTTNPREIYIYMTDEIERIVPFDIYFFPPVFSFFPLFLFFIFRTLLPSTHARAHTHTYTLSLPFSLISLGFLTRPIFVGARRVFPDRSHVNFRRPMTRQSLGPQTWRCRGGWERMFGEIFSERPSTGSGRIWEWIIKDRRGMSTLVQSWFWIWNSLEIFLRHSLMDLKGKDWSLWKIVWNLWKDSLIFFNFF